MEYKLSISAFPGFLWNIILWSSVKTGFTGGTSTSFLGMWAWNFYVVKYIYFLFSDFLFITQFDFQIFKAFVTLFF